MNPVVEEVTETLRQRSAPRRGRYLDHCRRTQEELPPKKRLSCGNLAHGYAACGEEEKALIAGMQASNIGIINAYNDMLSAHQPLALLVVPKMYTFIAVLRYAHVTGAASASPCRMLRELPFTGA